MKWMKKMKKDVVDGRRQMRETSKIERQPEEDEALEYGAHMAHAKRCAYMVLSSSVCFQFISYPC